MFLLFFKSFARCRFVVPDVQAIQVEQNRGRKIRTNLFLLQKTPFLAFKRLGALFVIAPLDGIAHRRHDGLSFCLFPSLFRLFVLVVAVCRVRLD
jgi:hypothetical protein